MCLILPRKNNACYLVTRCVQGGSGVRPPDCAFQGGVPIVSPAWQNCKRKAARRWHPRASAKVRNQWRGGVTVAWAQGSHPEAHSGGGPGVAPTVSLAWLG